MSKGIAAMSYLEPKEIVFSAGETCSVQAIKAVLNKIAHMQAEETPDGDYLETPCLMNQPFSACTWDITVAQGNIGGDYQVDFDTETVFETNSLGRAALSTRRAIDFGLAETTNEYTVRSIMAVVRFIEKLEDKVAQTGVGATGDATYTDISLKGNTPYETFVWTITKLDDVYTVVATANS